MEDISQMLHEMSKILSQPPGWLSLTIISTLMGAVGGFFSRFIGQLIVPDFVGRRSMRRALYRDLAEIFFTVDMFMDIDQLSTGYQDPDQLLWRQDQFRRLSFLGEKYYSDNPAIYIQLSERFAVKDIYRKLQYVLELPSTSLPFNTRMLKGTFFDFISMGVLKRKYFRKYLGKEMARKLFNKVDEYNSQQKNLIERLIQEAVDQKPQDGQVAQ